MRLRSIVVVLVGVWLVFVTYTLVTHEFTAAPSAAAKPAGSNEVDALLRLARADSESANALLVQLERLGRAEPPRPLSVPRLASPLSDAATSAAPNGGLRVPPEPIPTRISPQPPILVPPVLLQPLPSPPLTPSPKVPPLNYPTRSSALGASPHAPPLPPPPPPSHPSPPGDATKSPSALRSQPPGSCTRLLLDDG